MVLSLNKPFKKTQPFEIQFRAEKLLGNVFIR